MREPGLSAMLRVKNEQEWIEYAIYSILDWCDEVVVCVQNCTDNTEKFIHHIDKVKIYHYPHDSWPNGPGYYQQDSSSIHSRTYFYNWALAKTTRTHVMKWDGDMVAYEWLGEAIKTMLNTGKDHIKFHGLNFSEDIRYLSDPSHCPTDGVFKVTARTKYINGPYSEQLLLESQHVQRIEMPAFLHFKWAKADPIKAWPANWRQVPHFRKIYERRKPAKLYAGEYPELIRSKVYDALAMADQTG